MSWLRGAVASRIFVDTNVIAYAHDAAETRRQPIAQRVLEELWRDRSGVVSTQVLQEIYVVATRKFTPHMSRAEARSVVGAYGSWQLVHIDLPLIIAASRLEEEHTLSFWDALIVEAARRAGADRIVSEDLQDGRTFDGVTVENPFEE